MYEPSPEMPMDSFQIISPSENQTDFTAGQIIRFTIPRSIKFFDPHNSRLQFLVSTEGANYKMCFSDADAGVASLIQMIRVSQNGKIISEIQEYATLQKMVKSYSTCISMKQRDAMFKGLVDGSGDGRKAFSDNILLGEALAGDGSQGIASAQKQCKFQLELDYVALFELLYAVPMSAIGDLLIEIRLVPQVAQGIKVLPSTDFLIPSGTLLTGATSAVLTPPFTGFTCLGDSPFVTGMSFQTPGATGGTQHYEITAMSQAQGTGVITLTFSPGLVAGDNNKTGIKISKGADGNAPVAGGTKFVVNRAELLLQVVRPPDSYVADVASQVEAGEMIIDMDTYTTYRSTLLKEVKSQTVTIPTTQSRAKAFFVVPRSQSNPVLAVDGSSDVDLSGQYDSMLNYRSQINGTYYPNQPIPLNQYLGGLHFGQEHIRELKKAFDASGVGVKTLVRSKANFCLGRALAKYGSSMDLTGTPINVYVEYNDTSSPAQPRDVVAFVHHTVRMMVTPDGIEIMS
jgi:hypothetical protein